MEDIPAKLFFMKFDSSKTVLWSEIKLSRTVQIPSLLKFIKIWSINVQVVAVTRVGHPTTGLKLKVERVVHKTLKVLSLNKSKLKSPHKTIWIFDLNKLSKTLKILFKNRSRSPDGDLYIFKMIRVVLFILKDTPQISKS